MVQFEFRDHVNERVLIFAAGVFREEKVGVENGVSRYGTSRARVEHPKELTVREGATQHGREA